MKTIHTLIRCLFPSSLIENFHDLCKISTPTSIILIEINLKLKPEAKCLSMPWNCTLLSLFTFLFIDFWRMNWKAKFQMSFRHKSCTNSGTVNHVWFYWKICACLYGCSFDRNFHLFWHFKIARDIKV